MPGALQRDPFVHERAPVGARDGGFGGAQMPQPAKPQELHRPVFGWRVHLEDRTAVAHHHLAGEGEASGIDFGGMSGVGGTQIRRGDQETIGAERHSGKRSSGWLSGAPSNLPHPAAQQQPGQLHPIAESYVRHRGAHPFLPANSRAPVPASTIVNPAQAANGGVIN